MGMYDVVIGHVRCPYCGNIIEVEEQVKWTRDCFLHNYIVGDEIDAPNGIYDYSTYLRTPKIECDNCNKEVNYLIVVKDGKLDSLIPNMKYVTDEDKIKVENIRK